MCIYLFNVAAIVDFKYLHNAQQGDNNAIDVQNQSFKINSMEFKVQ